MSIKLTTSTSLTQDSCSSLCSTNGYNYAGMEYGQECWCSNALNQPTMLPESSCNVACKGEPSFRACLMSPPSLFGARCCGAGPHSLAPFSCLASTTPQRC